MTIKKMRRGATCALIAALAANPSVAQDSGVSISVSLDYVSEYVFRGVTRAESAVQPGIKIAYSGFYAGAWYSAPVGDKSNVYSKEIDLYAGYGFDLNDMTSLDFGGTYYYYPDRGTLFETNNGTGTYEVFGGALFDTFLSPSIYAYYDFELENFTLEGDIEHSIPAGQNISLDLGLTAGLVAPDFGRRYEYAIATAGIGYNLTDTVSVYANANYGLSSEDTFTTFDLNANRFVIDVDFSNNALWAGVGISAGF